MHRAIHASLPKGVPNNSTEQPKLDLFVDNTKNMQFLALGNIKLQIHLLNLLQKKIFLCQLLRVSPLKN